MQFVLNMFGILRFSKPYIVGHINAQLGRNLNISKSHFYVFDIPIEKFETSVTEMFSYITSVASNIKMINSHFYK